jgi:hypothetical protein
MGQTQPLSLGDHAVWKEDRTFPVLMQLSFGLLDRHMYSPPKEELCLMQ